MRDVALPHASLVRGTRATFGNGVRSEPLTIVTFEEM
jgi:hypothetical protein